MTKLESMENGSKRIINAYFRANDESHKWPICNKFNVTERAIRRLRGHVDFGYFFALESEIFRIVNAEV